MPSFFLYVGYAALALGTINVLRILWLLVFRRDRVNPFHLWIELLSMAYVLGVGFKAALIGPQWIRFHLADFGFPVMICELFVYRAIARGARAQPEEVLLRLDCHRVALWCSLGLSVAYEIVAGVLRMLYRSDAPALVGGFDIIDVICYLLGTLVGLYILRLWRLDFQKFQEDVRNQMGRRIVQLHQTDQVARRAAERRLSSRRRRSGKGRNG